MTLRRRSRQLIEAIYQAPASAWRRIELDSVSRQYKTPRILDQRITLPRYQGELRQIAILDLGHEDALSSAVAMKVTCDLQLTLMASSLYRLLGANVGNGYAEAKADHIFRDLVDATATVTLTDTEIQVRFQKRAHNPLLLAAGFERSGVPVPWLGGKKLRLMLSD
jgi:hypothetical protein